MKVIAYTYDGQLICADCIDQWIEEHNASIPEHTHQHLSKDDEEIGAVTTDSEVDCSRHACECCDEEIEETVIHSGCEHTPKMLALAEHLDIAVQDITEDSLTNYSVGNKEYLVLTDSEADEACEQNISEMLWAFNSSFIASHANCSLNSKAVQALEKMQGKLCEDANELVRALIKDYDAFIQDAISGDGRGHFLSGYDGEENEVGNFFIYRTN